MKTTFDKDVIELSPNGEEYQAVAGGRPVVAKVVRAEEGRLELLLDGQPVTAYVSSDGAKRWVTVNGQTFVLTKSTGRPRGGHAQHSAGELTAPMPGQIRAVNVSIGDPVSKGQTLMLLEAMKMEIRVQSHQDGRVKALHVEQGQTVEREQLLIEVE